MGREKRCGPGNPQFSVQQGGFARMGRWLLVGGGVSSLPPTRQDQRRSTVNQESDRESFDTYRAAETSTAAPSQSLLPAMLAGLGAALIGGIGWTALTAMTGYEVGYAAWALGGLVGFGMVHTTARRDSAAAGAAATLALVGLLIARVLIGELVLGGSALDEVLTDDELMSQAATLDLQFNEGFSEQVQVSYDAIPDGDTISDALWEEMVAEGVRHLETLSQEEREVMAAQFTGLAFSQAGLLGRVTAQMGPFDLLWAFLAVSTAWGMLKKEEESEPLTAGNPSG